MLVSAGYVLKLDIPLIPLETDPMTWPPQTLALFQILGIPELPGPCTVRLDCLPDWGPGVSLARQPSSLLLEELPASGPSLP